MNRIATINVKHKQFTFFVVDLTIEEGVQLLTKCVQEIHKRLIINLPNFKVQVISKDGIQDLEDITAAKIARSL